MSLKNIEALADAIKDLNNYQDPESEAYRLRNPGMLPARSLATLGDATADGVRRFSCHQAGYKALTDILEKQCARYGTGTLGKMLRQFGHGSEFEVVAALDFIHRATGITASPETELRIFTENR